MLAKHYRLQIQNWLRDRNKKVASRKSEFFILRESANNLDYNRFGVIISAKVSKSAVQRNRIKRVIYNFIRLNKFYDVRESQRLISINPRFAEGGDVVITVLPATTKLEKEEIEKELLLLLRAKP